MLRYAFLFVLAISVSLPTFAQADGADAQANQAATAGSVQTGPPAPTVAQTLSLEPGYATSISSWGQQGRSQPQQKPKPGKPSANSTSAPPPIEGSMVGYIDNAIVGSEIRLRFDAGFDSNHPDRAEFFYAQCGCDGGTAQGPRPGLVTHLNFQQLYMRAEYAPISRFSVFAELPIRWVQPQNFVPQTIPASGGFPNQSGISDLQAGFKFAVIASHERYLTFQLRAYFPSGDSLKALGTNHYSVEPSVLYFQRLTDRWSFEGQLGDLHPFEGASPGFQADVLTYGLGPSYELYRGERVRFAPVVELVGWRVLGGLENSGDALLQQINAGAANPNPVISSDGTNIVNLKVGARTTIGDHNSFYVGFGQALTHEMWYKHIVRIEYRFTF